MSDKTTIAAGIDISANVNNALSGIRQLSQGLGDVNSQLEDILKHFDALNNKSLGKIKKQVNKYDFNSASNVAVSQAGTIATNNGKDKLFQDYEQAFIDGTKAQTELTNEIKTDTAERKKLRKQRADSETQRANNEAARIAKMEDRTSKSYMDIQAKLAEAKLLNAKANQVGSKLRNPSYQLGNALGVIGGRLNTVGVGSDKIEGKLLGGILSTVGQSLKHPVAGAMTAIANLTTGIMDLGEAALKAYTEIESIKTQLGVVFSNQTQADSMFNEISQYAVKSPFGVQQTSELAVLLKQSGVYASDLMNTLKMIGDTAGGNMEKMKRIANNYAQIVSIGKASMLDMRQFAYAGIPIFEAVSKELGVSQQELRKLISDGKVTSDIIEKVFKDLTGINGIFENATEKGAKTLKARLQNLTDAKQLAISSIGEYGVSLGERTGGDSFVNNLVTLAENIYSYLKTEVSTINIEKNVETIANRDATIEKYQKLVEFAKSTGSKSLEAAFTAKLNKELAKLNPDEARSVYVQAYKNKTKGFDLAAENGVFGSVSSIQKEIDELYNQIEQNNKNYWKKNGLMNSNSEHMLISRMYHGWGSLWGDVTGNAPRGSEEALQNEAIAERVKLLEEIVRALNGYKDISEQLKNAIKEDTVIKAQQLQFDQTNSNANSSTSLNASFNELASIYENSDEYQRQEEEKKLEILKNAQEELKKIAEHTDDKGELRFNEYDRGEFQRLNDAGAFNAAKLGIVQNNRQLTSDNRALLESQFANASGRILEELSSSRIMSSQMGRQAAQAFEESFMSLASATTDEDFFDRFAVVLYDMQNTLKQLEDFNPSEKEWLQELGKYLVQSTNKYETRTKGVDADLNDLNKKKGKELADYIPLWKRVVASATGWSAENITSSKDFMSEYQKYSAQQVSRGGIQALANAGGRAGEIGLLLSYSNKTNKQGVKQVDWEKTEKNIYNYALSLETPLKKASATMNGLADAMKTQVQTYRKLTADLYTVGEDWTTINNDIKGQYKTAQGLGNADILDNAFQAFSKESDKYKLSYDEEKGLVIYDKLGDKIVGAIDELKGNGNISNPELKAFLDNVKVDTLISVIDKAASATEKNATVTQTNADLLSIANNIREEREKKDAEAAAISPAVIAALKNSNLDSKFTNGLTLRDKNSEGYMNIQTFEQTFSVFLKNLMDQDLNSKKPELPKEITDVVGDKVDIQALKDLQNAVKLGDADTLYQALVVFIQQFPDALKTLMKEISLTTLNTKTNELTAAANTALNSSPMSIREMLLGTNKPTFGAKNNFQENVLKDLGTQYVTYDELMRALYENAIVNPEDNKGLLSKYKEYWMKLLKKNGTSEEKMGKISSLIDTGVYDKAELDILTEGYGRDIFSEGIKSANEFILSLGRVGTALEDINKNGQDLAKNFAANAITSTMETWGKTLMTAADDSKEIGRNLASLSAGLLKNMGSMITQAGLSLAISSTGNRAGVIAGLAIAAAGGGLSFLGGMIDGKLEENDNKEDDKYQRLLQIKQDLTDLLKQAREDSIYYENTVRHKKAISANENFTKSKSVHDAVITPSGQVVTTDPRDYLIATKTPKTLVGGGAPTINFNVVDKSTGIRVTEQRSNYNPDTNSIDFEAIIESKVQEVIATSKGDEAFIARETRLNGRTVIA